MIADLANERAAAEMADEFAEKTQGKRYSPSRIYHGMRYAVAGDLIRRNKKIKHKKALRAEKWDTLSLTGQRADLAEMHGGQAEWNRKMSAITLTSAMTQYSEVKNSIDTLCRQYYRPGATMSDAEFTNRVQDIFNLRGTYATNPTHRRQLGSLLRTLKRQWVNINRSASNLLSMVQLQKAENDLKTKQTQTVMTYMSIANPPGPTPDETNRFISDSVALIRDFTSNYKRVPQLFDDINNQVGAGTVNVTTQNYEQIAELCATHYAALGSIAARAAAETIDVEVQFVKKWRAANKSVAKRLSRGVLRPIERVTRQHRMIRYPVKALVVGWATFGWAVLWGGIGWVAAWSVTTWIFAAWKQSAQTREATEAKIKEFVKARDTHEADMNTNRETRHIVEFINQYGRFDEIARTMVPLLQKESPLTADEQQTLKEKLSMIEAWMDFSKKRGIPGFAVESINATDTANGISTPDQKISWAMSQLRQMKDSWFNLIGRYDSGFTPASCRTMTGAGSYAGFAQWYKWKFKQFARTHGWKKHKSAAITWLWAWSLYAGMAGLWFAATTAYNSVAWVDFSGTGTGPDGTPPTGWDGWPTPAPAPWWGDWWSPATRPPSLDDTWYSDTYKGTEWSNPNNISPSPLQDASGMSSRHYTFDPAAYQESLLFRGNFDRDVRSLLMDPSVVGKDATVELHYAWSTDALSASNKFQWSLQSTIADIRRLLDNNTFSSSTEAQVRDAISDDNIKRMINVAKSHGAKDGNMYLWPTRWLEVIEQTLDEMIKSKRTDINLKLAFDEWAVNTQKVWSGSVGHTHRNFHAAMKVFNSDSGWTWWGTGWWGSGWWWWRWSRLPSLPSLPWLPSITGKVGEWTRIYGPYVENNHHREPDNTPTP